MRVGFLGVLLASGLWLVLPADVRADRPGARVEVQAPGVHVDVGDKNKDMTGTNIQSGPIARASELIGVRVYSPGNENLGKIEDLVIDPKSGKIRYAVLSFGGFLGMGEKLFAVPWDNLSRMTKGLTSQGMEKEEHYVLDVSKEALKRAPGFDKDRWPDFANPNWARDIDQFYSTERAEAARRTGRPG